MESRYISYGAAVRSCNTLCHVKTLRMFLAVRKIILRYVTTNRPIDIHWMFFLWADVCVVDITCDYLT